MGNHFKITVNDTFQFDIDKDVISQVDSVSIEANKFHVLQDAKPYEVEITTSDFLHRKYSVKVNGSTYNVAIVNDLDVLIKEMGFEVGASKQINSIKAPMPGLILEISVSVGQEVQVNDNLLILEAMKMENSILSPRNGIIKSIIMEKGAAVDKGQLLIEFE